MKLLIIFVLAILMVSCVNPVILKEEPPLKYSFMPSYLKTDSLRPYILDDTSRVVDSTYEDFVSIPIDGGKLIGSNKDTLKLPAGILISDRKAALYPFYKSGWERQRKELEYTNFLMEEYYKKANSAEVLYQDEIIKLNKKVERSWLEKNMGYIGFLSGVSVSVLIFVAVINGGSHL